MKKLILLIMFFITPALATANGIGLFSTGIGTDIGMQLSLGNESRGLLYKVDLSFSMAKDIRGIGASIGYDLGNAKIYIGRSEINGQPLTSTININNETVISNGSGNGIGNFIEIEVKRFYVRHIVFNIDYTLGGRLQTGETENGNPIYTYGSESGKRFNVVTWVGYRFPF